MRNNCLYSIAAFMIVLIISLPVYSSVVFASLSNPSIKGSDNIEGYIRDQDSVTIKVNAYTDGTLIDPSQLHLYDQSGPAFNLGCIPTGGGYYDCSIQTDSSDLTSPVNALLYYNTKRDVLPIEFYKDTSPPTIITFTSSPSIIGSGNINFNYKVEDTIDGNTGKCSGIKELILTSGTYSRIIPINTNPDKCINEGSFIENVDTITSAQYGNITVEAKAYDNFGQESSPVTTSFIVDKAAPSIDINSFKILDSNNNELHYFSGIMTTSASVEISDLDIASVIGNFSSLSPANNLMPAICTNDLCTWNNVVVDLTYSGNKAITITAKDTLSNTKKEAISYFFEFDNTQPVITSVKTNHLDSNGKSYLGNGKNTIIVEIDEAGIGFNNKDVYLDLRNINNKPTVQANNCTDEGIFWKCYFNNVAVTASDGSKQISVKSDSKDDLGNAVTGTLTYDLIIDLTEPIIGEITYTPQAPTSSDTINFNIKVTDSSNQANIIINSSAISTTPEHTDSCTGSSGNIDCSALVSNIVSSYTAANVPITIEDAAGNKAAKEKQVTIYQSNPDSTPAFFSVSNIELIPARVDRKVASQIPLNIYVRVNLQRSGSGAIIGKTVDCMEIAAYLAESPYIMNEYEKEPYIALKLNQAVGAFEENFPIKCKLRLQVRDSQYSYGKYEEEEINAELELYGNILGNMEENIAEKLEAITNDIQSVDGKINDFEEWLKIFGIYCTIAQTIGQLNMAFQALKAAIWGVVTPIWTACAACCGGPTAPICCPCMVAAHASWTAACTPSNLFHQLADSFFWPIGAHFRQWTSPWTFPGWLLKIACMVFWNCALSSWDGILGLAGEAISMLGASKVQNDPQKKYENYDEVTVKQGGEDVTYTRSTNSEGKVEWKTTSLKFKDNVYDDASIDIFMNIKGTRSSLVNRPPIIYTKYDSGGNPIVRQGDDIFVVNRETGDTIKVIEIENLPPVDDRTYRTIFEQKVNAKLSTFDIAPDGGYRLGNLFSRITYTTIGKVDASGNPIVQDNNYNYYRTNKDRQIHSRISIASGANEIYKLSYLPDAPEGRYQFGTDFIPTEESKSLLSKGIDIAKTGMETSGNNPYLWSQAGQKTETGGIFEENYMFDPYKSIHYAEISMCLPAIVYNLKKDKQIKCMYRNCIQNHLMSGQTTTVCDFAYKERECLYVESAQFLKHGYGGWMDNLMNALLKYAVFLILGWVITEGPCKPYFSPGTAALCADIPPGAMSITSVTCGLLGAAIAFMEFNAILNSEFGMNGDGRMELQGEDYCMSGNDGL